MNTSRSNTIHPQSFVNNSLAIRQEIQRFESVHPSIYAIYDLIELIPDTQIAQQIRDHVVCIEDSFVNSQEWTISRSVPHLRLGIVGSLNSGKSALVHRYLTGSYMQEESPEGGRFKKEIYIDNQSYLLLIRDEGGPPEMQFAEWVDAVIFVFSLENEASFNTVYNYYTKLSHFRKNSEIPIILVGTQDAISERNPRVLDDSRARKLASDLKNCSYYETCATYGLNVERVFQDACLRIVHQHFINQSMSQSLTSRPTTPQDFRLSASNFQYSLPFNNLTQCSICGEHYDDNVTTAHRHHVVSTPNQQHNQVLFPQQPSLTFQNNPHKWSTISHASSQKALITLTNENNDMNRLITSNPVQNQIQFNAEYLTPLNLVPPSCKDKDSKRNNSSSGGIKDLLTPVSTPTTSRKSRRRSNLFISSSKKIDDKHVSGELGSGRSIPLKQGYLYKRSSKSLNREWKKKYVTLCDDGRLTYHPSLHDYMENVHGKEISLQYVTVKVPGQKPRGSKSIITNSVLISSVLTNEKSTHNNLNEGLNCLSISKENKKITEKVLLTAFDTLRESVKSNSPQQTSGDEGIAMSNSNSQTFLQSDNNQIKIENQTPNIRKRHRRIKSSGIKNNEIDDSDGFEFYIVSLDNKQWHFEAANSEERDEWVNAIEQEIFKSLQGIKSSKTKSITSNEAASLTSIRSQVLGNGFCADCDAPNPEWASLNLGILICIECSGIHRNLGSHITKVRSLGLDDWPLSHLSVMLAIGNSLANSVWEANTKSKTKPTINSSREEKEAWIRSKYEAKEFLPECNKTTISQELFAAVVKCDIKSLILLLAHANNEEINKTISSKDRRTPLHLACAAGNLAISQLLIWNNANIKQIDHDERTCLSYAKVALATAKNQIFSSVITTKTSTSKISSVSSSNDSTASVASCVSNDSCNDSTNVNQSVEEAAALVDLLVGLGCSDSASFTTNSTFSRRRDTLGTPYEKLISGVI